MPFKRLSESTVLTGLSKVPPFPPIAARLLILLANESVDLAELAEVVGSDPTFSARLLRCANSIEFGLANPVSDVRRALAFLGLDQTRQIIVTLDMLTPPLRGLVSQGRLRHLIVASLEQRLGLLDRWLYPIELFRRGVPWRNSKNGHSIEGTTEAMRA